MPVFATVGRTVLIFPYLCSQHNDRAFTVKARSGSVCSIVRGCVCVCALTLVLLALAQPPPVVAMVQMMESQCEYFMYFPAVPITDLSDPARYRTLPRRSHLYLGETVRFLLVLRCRDGGATPTEHGPGKEAGSRGEDADPTGSWWEGGQINCFYLYVGVFNIHTGSDDAMGTHRLRHKPSYHHQSCSAKRWIQDETMMLSVERNSAVKPSTQIYYISLPYREFIHI